MMASFGPLQFNPGDSQFVALAFAAGQGADNIASVEVLKTLFGYIDELPLYELQTAVIDTIESEEATPDLPTRFEVHQNYPNPFNPYTTIEYALTEEAHVMVEVFNVLGQRIRLLVNETQPAQDHEVVWDGTDDGGQRVSSGLYFYRVTAGNFMDKKKMLLLK
jgi:hypothetical protein